MAVHRQAGHRVLASTEPCRETGKLPDCRKIGLQALTPGLLETESPLSCAAPPKRGRIPASRGNKAR
jgi:hypothetical protein